MPQCVRFREGKEGGGKGALVQIDKSGTIACGNDQIILAIDRYNMTVVENKAPSMRTNVNTEGLLLDVFAIGKDRQQARDFTTR